MRDPVYRLKIMPWGKLFQGAALTTVVAVLLDLALLILAVQVNLLARTLQLLFAPPLGIIMNIVVYVGVGVMGIRLLERFFPQLSLNSANLWGFLFCLMVVMALTSFLPIPGLLIGASQGSVLGLLVGVFIGGMRYWR